MPMREQNLVQLLKADSAAQNLPLSSFAAVHEETMFPGDDRE